MSLKQIAFWQTLIADTPDCMKARCYRKLAEDIDWDEHFRTDADNIRGAGGHGGAVWGLR